MLDVHPPEHAAHTWRDFLIHIATIVVGLLIAIGLEQTVEFFHHRHLLHTAESNLAAEIRGNRTLIETDLRQLDENQLRIQTALLQIAAARAHRPVPDRIDTHWSWDGPRDAAWTTAHDNGALALMPNERAEEYATLYGEQKIVDMQATLYIRDIYLITATQPAGMKLSEVPPAGLDTMTANAEQALADLRLLRDLAQSYQRVYFNSERLAHE